MVEVEVVVEVVIVVGVVFNILDSCNLFENITFVRSFKHFVFVFKWTVSLMSKRSFQTISINTVFKACVH